jgi:hypothetical protein
MVAKAGGNGDPVLDEMVAKMKPEDRAEAEKAAKPWFDVLAGRSNN